MITDNALRFGTNQTMAGTANGTVDLDLGGSTISGGTYGDPGYGSTLNLYVISTAAATGSTAGNTTITLLTADDTAFTVNAATLITSAALANTGLTAGNLLLFVPVPQGLRRYVRITFTIAGGNPTTTSITSGLAQIGDLNSATLSEFLHD